METITNPEIQNLPPITPQNNNYKILFFLSSGLFLITASVLATLLITQKSSKPTQTVQPDTEETEPTSTEMIIPGITNTEIIPTTSESEVPSGWKTYTDSTYKFSISYPSNWTFSKTKEGISLETPEYKKEIERQIEELKRGDFPEGEGPNASGRYFISCFQSLTDLKNSNFSSATTETNRTSLYNFLLENSYTNNDMSGLKYFLNLKKINVNGLTSYQVENEGPVQSLSVFIQNKSLSICKIDLSGITTETLSETESKFINTFKFN